MLSINPFPTIYQPFTIMKVRTIHTAVVFLLSLICSTLCVYALDDIVLEPPLTWSVKSVLIGWSASQGEKTTTESVFLYEADESWLSNPMTEFGLYGTDVTASVYEEGGMNYSQTDPQTNPAQWSMLKKEKVRRALTAAFESSGQKTVSNQQLIITVNFVNHTKSQLKFDYRYTNYIPVYIGQTEIGKAAPVGIDKVVISIPPTGDPVSVKFAMPIDEQCKLELLNYKPFLKFSEGQLFLKVPFGEPEIEGNVYRKSAVDKGHFNVAILVGDEFKEWKINWIDRNPVTLQEALEAINDKIRLENRNDKTVFEIKDNRFVSVCGTLFAAKLPPDWITELIYVRVFKDRYCFFRNSPYWVVELKTFKDGAFQTVTDLDSLLSETPHSGERYVFQIVDLELKKLIEKANAGDPESLNNLGDRYYCGCDYVSEDKVKAAELYRKSADQGYAEGQYNLGKCYLFGNGVDEDSDEAAKWFQKAALRGHEDAAEMLEFLNESDK